MKRIMPASVWAKRLGMRLTPWQCEFIDAWCPAVPIRRQRPAPLPIDGHAYRNRRRNRRTK